MRVSFAITVCNEYAEIQKLLNFLLSNKRQEDEIVVLVDTINTTPALVEYLQAHRSLNNIVLEGKPFEKHFADWKNTLTKLCTGDFIFQIDADEIPSEYLVKHLYEILEANPQVDVYLTPRINTVEGLTEAHIAKWNWKVDSNNWVNFPDYQWRIYRNVPYIKWVNKVHEKLSGFLDYAFLPATHEFCLTHAKTIAKQEKQNNYYDTL